MSRRASRHLPRVAVLMVLTACCTMGEGAFAQDETSRGPARPFVEHRVALQLSDAAADKQAFVLSMANKFLTTYGPDAIDIQVVAMGPGISLVQRNSPYRARVDSLIAQGVTFDVCDYTLETIERETGHRPAINPKAVEVPAGGPFLLSLAEKQYTIIRP